MKKFKWLLLILVLAACGSQESEPQEMPEILDAGYSWWMWEQDGRFDESFIMRTYAYRDWDDYEYFLHEIQPDRWREQVIEIMANNVAGHRGIEINRLWYEETRLIVDLTHETAVYFNWGSLGGALRTSVLIRSMASLPDVTEIEVLVGGQRGIWADHFNFARVFRVN